MREEELEAWIHLLRKRRSRRFCKGMEIPAGPFRYKSAHQPQPLTTEQESILAFSAAGITGGALNEVDYSPEGGGNIIAGKLGRTIASGDALRSVSVVVINDDGAFHLPRPRELSDTELEQHISITADHHIEKVYTRQRVQFLEKRPESRRDPIFNININRWSANAEGTTIFLPINDLTPLYINGLLEIFNSHTGVFALDERNNFHPAGVGKFAQSKGGHLDNNPNNGKVVTVRHIESMVTEFAAIEQGMIMQNLALSCEALGLAGYPSFANHEFGWFEALGFEMKSMRAGQYLGAPKWIQAALSLLGQNPAIPYPTGLKTDDRQLMKAPEPDKNGSMRSAVMEIVERKFGNRGAFGSTHPNHPWKNEEAVNREVPRLEEAAIEATVAYCDYLWKRYGRFPVHFAPYRTVTCFQAGVPDPEFYQKFMK